MRKADHKMGIVDDLDLYYKIFNSLRTPIFLKDSMHRFVLVNDEFCRMFGAKPEDYIGKEDSELFPVTEWMVFRDRDRKILDTGEPDVNEEFATTSDGKRLRVVTRKSLLETHSGAKFVLGVITDITERTALLKKLKESEKKYKTIFNLGSDPSAVFNYPELTAVDVNDSFINLSHVPRSTVIGKTATHAFSWVDKEQRRIYFDRLTRDKKVDNMEILLRTGSGKDIPFLVSSRMVKLGRKQTILYSLRDISDIKQAQRSLRESESLYKALVNNSPNLILIHINGTIVFVNNTAIDFFSLTCEEIIGRNIADLLKIQPKPQKGKWVTWKKFTPQSVPGELQVIYKEHEIRSFLIRNTWIQYKGSDAVMSILTDITDTKNLENFVLSKIIETEENERRRLAADLHDDLGPVLSAINLHLGLLDKTKEPEILKKDIRVFEDMVDMVIRKVHRISHSITPHLIDDFGIEASVRDFCNMVSISQQFQVNFESNLHKTRFPIEIERHFYRIITELINNSIKHSGATRLNINLGFSSGCITINYSDNGKGYNVAKILKKPSGMGIPNIIQRVKLMSGDIDFRTTAGRTEVVIRKKVREKSETSG